MREREKPDLSSIEPLRPPADADADAAPMAGEAVNRVGRAAAEITNTPPAVGVEAETDRRERDGEPITSPETEGQLEQLRRG